MAVGGSPNKGGRVSGDEDIEDEDDGEGQYQDDNEMEFGGVIKLDY